MLRKALLTACTLSLSFLAGCASQPSVTEFQCRAGDWQTIGMRDGSQGLPRTNLLRHQEACGPFGIVPERAEYVAGWEQGLTTFCTADNGFSLGERGGKHHNVCHSAEFVEAYNDGRSLFQARQEVRQLEQKIAVQEQRLIDIRQEIIGVTTAQLVPDLTVSERVALVAKFEALVEERQQVTEGMPKLRRQLARSQQSLEQLNLDLAYAH